MTDQSRTEETAEEPEQEAVGTKLTPGSAAARDRGCACSVLANAPRVRQGGVDPFIDPGCSLHTIP